MAWRRAVGKVKAEVQQATAPHLPPLNARLGDWSGALRDEAKFQEEFLDQLTLPGQMTAVAFEPGLGVLAVGTSAGTVHLFGAPPVRLSMTLRPALRVKHLVFKSDTYLLLCLDEKDNMSVYDLSRQDPHAASLRTSGAPRAPPGAGASGGHSGQLADAPLRVGTHTARNAVLCTEVTASHAHFFLGLADGTVEAYDLERFGPAPFRIPNLWWEVEEAARRTNEPDAPSRLHIPLIIAMQTHPHDISLLLLCYEGGAVLYSLREKHVVRTYALRLYPGAPGPYADAPLEYIWIERACPATAIAWSPNGEQFAMGHENGCISFWSVKDEDRPLEVRTLDEEHVDRAVAPEDLAQRPSTGPREPIFKLTWSAFPAPGWYEAAAGALGAVANDADAQAKETSTNGTILTVMGGTPVRANAACLHALHLPPPPAQALWAATTPEAQHKVRLAQQASIVPTHISLYRTSASVEDFVLLPRLSPHYSGTYDPYAILVLTGMDDTLPPLAAQVTHRGLEAYTFPSRATDGEAYAPLDLPLPLQCTGRGTVLGASVASVPLATYRRLVHGAPDTPAGSIHPAHPMAGFATPRIHGGAWEHAEGIAQAGQPRLLVTWHLDGTVRFSDVSPHLLLLATDDPRHGPVLPTPFPAPFPHATISVRDNVLHTAVLGEPALRSLQRSPKHIHIADVQVAWESMEVSIRLVTGHVVHYAYAAASASGMVQLTESMQAAHVQDHDIHPPAVPECTSLASTAQMHTAGFHGRFAYLRSTCRVLSAPDGGHVLVAV